MNKVLRYSVTGKLIIDILSCNAAISANCTSLCSQLASQLVLLSPGIGWFVAKEQLALSTHFFVVRGTKLKDRYVAQSYLSWSTSGPESGVGCVLPCEPCQHIGLINQQLIYLQEMPDRQSAQSKFN